MDDATLEPIVEVDLADIEQVIEQHKSMTLLDTDSIFDVNSARMHRMSQVVSKFAATLTLRPINVELITPDSYQDVNKTAPAWSDSDNIWFNESMLGDITDPAVVTSLKGLSLHEIAHILLTPRNGSNLAKEIQRAKLWQAFNALEDQRIEMMLTKRFGNVADWFTATVAQFIASDPTQHSVSFPIIHGRKYLPIALRKMIRDMYEKPQDIAEIESLIDRYIVLNLNDPKNYTDAFAIVKRFDELISVGLRHQQTDPYGYTNEQGGWSRIKDPNGHDSRKHGEWKSSKSKPMSKSEQAKLADKVADAVGKQDSYGNEPAPDSSNNGDGSQGIGSGGDDADSPLTAAAKTIIQDVMRRKARDINDTIKQFNGDVDLKSKSMKSLDRAHLESVAPSLQAVSNVRSFAKELQQLKADYDPGWLRRTDSGRLNVQRYMVGDDLDECFDQWDDGREDAVDIEAVILLDISGSMGDVIREAYEAMWVMKRSLDKVNANTTVVTFSSWSQIVYSNDERAGSQMRSGGAWGGTNPDDALDYARNVLAESNRAIKVFIAITDGDWYGDKGDKVIMELRRGGVVTALAFIQTNSYGGPNTNINTHGCEVAADIREISGILTLGKHIVKAGISRNLAV